MLSGFRDRDKYVERKELRTLLAHNPYPVTSQNQVQRSNPNKNELKAGKTTKRDLHIAFSHVAQGDRSENGLQPTKLRNRPVNSNYPTAINRQVGRITTSSHSNGVVRPKSVNSPPALFSSNSQSTKNWKSGSTSSLTDILPSYNPSLPNTNDYPYDESIIGADHLANSGSYSDSEITLTLEESTNDEAAVNGLSIRLQQGLVTDVRSPKDSTSSQSDFNSMKNVVQEIASQLTPPQQDIIYATTDPNSSQQYQLFDDPTFMPVSELGYHVDNQQIDSPDSFKNERIEIIENAQQTTTQIIQTNRNMIQTKTFKVPTALTKQGSKVSQYGTQIVKNNQFTIHQTDGQGISKGQSKLVDEAYDDTGTVAEIRECESPQPVDFILVAATSPSTKVNEESLTYLNQGQSYGIRMNRRPEEFKKANLPFNTPLRIQLRVIFHDRRLQNTEDEQLKTWSKTRPGERFLEIVSELSENISDVSINPIELNCSEFSWSTKKTAIAFIVLNCISTEFTQRRHGGERGAPFRIQADVFKEGDTPHISSNCIQAASCQVRVFKPRGADRKLKTDHEKISKKIDNPHEKNKFSVSYNRTRLMPAAPWEPRNQIKLNAKHENDPAQIQVLRMERMDDYQIEQKFDIGSREVEQKQYSRDMMSPVETSPINTYSTSTQIVPVPQIQSGLNITENASISFVQQWLRRKSFHNFQSKFSNFSGNDMLSLQREDFIQIGQEGPSCMPIAECIRLYNAVRSSKTSEASNNLVLYVRLPGDDNSDCYYPLFLKEKTVHAFITELAIKLNMDPNVIDKIVNKRKTTFQSAGINVMVTDDMVASFKSESSYKVVVGKSNASITITIQQTG